MAAASSEIVLVAMPSEEAVVLVDPPAGYEVLGYIAKGGQGSVYSVRNNTDLKTYALKRVPYEQHAIAMKEISIMEKASDCGIPRVKTVQVQENKYIDVVMDFVSGGTVETWIRSLRTKGGELSSQTIWRFVYDISKILVCLKNNKIIHADIKPSNILITSDGHFVLADFGLAVETNDEEYAEIHGGTLRYMAPEVIVKSKGTYSSDVWSFGMTLMFICAFGKNPLKSKTGRDMKKELTSFEKSLPHLMDSIDIIDEDLEMLLLRTLQLDANDRDDIEDISDMAEEYMFFME